MDGTQASRNSAFMQRRSSNYNGKSRAILCPITAVGHSKVLKSSADHPPLLPHQTVPRMDCVPSLQH